MSDAPDKPKLPIAGVAANLQIGKYQKHFFICTGPKCCTELQGMTSWKFLKGRLKELGLREGKIYCTKVGCLRLCQDGPIGVVYPEGVWYKGLTPNVLERVINEHLQQGKVVDEYCFARGPLKAE